MPVLLWRGFNFGNCDFDRVLKIENNFKSHYFDCFGLLSTSTFENERNWLGVIGTLTRSFEMTDISVTMACGFS